MLTAIANAVTLGFAIAVPIGPVSLLCMQRTLALGSVAGTATGLGIAAADACYAIVVAAGFSLSADIQFIETSWFKVLAGILVAFIGLKILKAPPVEAASNVTDATLRWCFVSGFLLTLTNPVTVLLLVAGFAVLGLAEPAIDLVRASILIAGVFAGSMIWWSGLVAGVSIIRQQISQRFLQLINRATGAGFIVFGVVAIGYGLFFS
jgi:putative LysE/RhtB family amino acid efflux pump